MNDEPNFTVKGTRSPRWALMQKFIIPVRQGEGEYVTRWRIITTPWFGILLHKILSPDPDLYTHDHPWSFVSIILKGGYTESFRSSKYTTPRFRTHNRFGINRIMRGQFHLIHSLHEIPTWTLLFHGPRRGTWGFLTPDGWMEYSDYLRPENWGYKA